MKAGCPKDGRLAEGERGWAEPCSVPEYITLLFLLLIISTTAFFKVLLARAQKSSSKCDDLQLSSLVRAAFLTLSLGILAVLMYVSHARMFVAAWQSSG